MEWFVEQGHYVVIQEAMKAVLADYDASYEYHLHSSCH